MSDHAGKVRKATREVVGRHATNLRKLAQQNTTGRLPYVCPECGQGYATEDGAADCRLTCYQKEGF